VEGALGRGHRQAPSALNASRTRLRAVAATHSELLAPAAGIGRALSASRALLDCKAAPVRGCGARGGHGERRDGGRRVPEGAWLPPLPA
jgi:hypothetical protein